MGEARWCACEIPTAQIQDSAAEHSPGESPRYTGKQEAVDYIFISMKAVVQM